ncbi:MAG: CocE/NonD family hydrolase C-terminal non-catalytic domain-containing protein, partial [Acetobacteraceae bacterium]
EVNLFVASDAPDTDFTAKLIDVHPRSEDYPQGYAMLLGDGILEIPRPRGRHGGPHLTQPSLPQKGAERFSGGEGFHFDERGFPESFG